jgi:hypothetical protein
LYQNSKLVLYCYIVSSMITRPIFDNEPFHDNHTYVHGLIQSGVYHQKIETNRLPQAHSPGAQAYTNGSIRKRRFNI